MKRLLLKAKNSLTYESCAACSNSVKSHVSLNFHPSCSFFKNVFSREREREREREKKREKERKREVETLVFVIFNFVKSHVFTENLHSLKYRKFIEIPQVVQKI